MPTDLRQEGISCIEDLFLLTAGDVVNMVYQNVPAWRHPDPEEKAVAYRGRSTWGSLEWAHQAQPAREHIILITAKLRDISIKDGRVIISEDHSVSQSFTPEQNPFYQALKETLELGGIWNAN